MVSRLYFCLQHGCQNIIKRIKQNKKLHFLIKLIFYTKPKSIKRNSLLLKSPFEFLKSWNIQRIYSPIFWLLTLQGQTQSKKGQYLIYTINVEIMLLLEYYQLETQIIILNNRLSIYCQEFIILSIGLQTKDPEKVLTLIYVPYKYSDAQHLLVSFDEADENINTIIKKHTLTCLFAMKIKTQFIIVVIFGHIVDYQFLDVELIFQMNCRI